ncbi:FAD-dependent monooxygenase [Taibaiella chishuiensis]|uniref:2-polyprenyl-6-methoxyphenol hydroxylase-like FAD-dependent oxidoreductase n=1 Tax=Taibaiella chishuiensis TaxID=1434707 RepID=A0A2P8CXY9_9BACT|nr:FAD-dependent monooxygenase [Taibaiella chishuiensis]PSK89822.1 2-polyprenyl-6-methoxyphenol hydroxylase-like FAD-dependent oxidoreductase [Taibaiella chishuiensis]
MNAITANGLKPTTAYDVIIAGAGPVGLFLACELALAQCTVLVLEKADQAPAPLKQLPFGIRGLSAPTIEALYRRNLLGELQLHQQMKNPHQNAKQGAQRQVGHFAGIPITEGHVDSSRWTRRLPGATPSSLISSIDELETVFTRRALELGVEIQYGQALTGFEQANAEVQVYCSDQAFKAQWLVGCDGSRSIVRKAGGFTFAGTEPEFTGYSTRMELDDASLLKPGRNVTARGMYLQSQPGYIMIQDFDGGAFHSSGLPVTRAHIQEVLRRVSGTDVTVTDLQVATSWTDRARQATAYRKGRVLLAGDAAHIHSPLGGQGLNLGLGDAINLGWKLAAVIGGRAPEHLLDSYDTERHPIGAAVLDWSRAQVALMQPTAAARALYAIVGDLLDTCDGATYVAGRIWGIDMHYKLEGAHPLTGYSMPAFTLEHGAHAGSYLQSGRGLLLDFEVNPALQSLVTRYSQALQYIPGKAADRQEVSALLVRPDGMVAWACDGDTDLAALEKALGTWFMPDNGTGH